MDKHSPTPWRVVTYDGSAQCDIYDAHGTPVCTMGHFADAPEADAALIAEAVNEHVARHRLIDVETLDHVASDRDRLRELVRRLADELGDAIEEAVDEWRSNLEAEWEEPDFTSAKALLREAREALGEDKP